MYVFTPTVASRVDDLRRKYGVNESGNVCPVGAMPGAMVPQKCKVQAISEISRGLL